jgi:hypothetical protein
LSDVIVQVTNEPAPSLRAIDASIPAELEGAVARCLDKNPARRFQHVADLALALCPLGTERARRTLERVLRLSGERNERSQTTLDHPSANAADDTAAARGRPARAPHESRASRRRSSHFAIVFALLAAVGFALTFARLNRQAAQLVAPMSSRPIVSPDSEASASRVYPSPSAAMVANASPALSSVPGDFVRPVPRVQNPRRAPAPQRTAPAQSSQQAAASATPDPMSLRR